MIDLTNRSLQKELLDADDIPFAAIQQNMEELNTVNHLLGGHTITLKGFKELIKGANEPITVCEIGCGGGDNLRVLYNYALKEKIAIRLIGIDIKSSCIKFASEKNNDMQALWICSDYRTADMRSLSPDIIFSSLFCHHFAQQDLVFMMGWMNSNCKRGFFVNDLHRHPLAYYSIKWLTGLFSKSYLVKNDAPLSVARGFKKQEWLNILKDAGIPSCKVQWKWAFRYLVIFKK